MRLTLSVVLFFLVMQLNGYLHAQESNFRIGIEHGSLFPVDSSLYDDKDSVYYFGLKQGLYLDNRWSIEFSQRYISPQNGFLKAGKSTGQAVPRDGGLYHLEYDVPLSITARYDLREQIGLSFRPYFASGIALHYTKRRIDQVSDVQWTAAPLLVAGVEIFQAKIKAAVEVKYETFNLKSTSSGFDAGGTGGGLSFGVGVIF